MRSLRILRWFVLIAAAMLVMAAAKVTLTDVSKLRYADEVIQKQHREIQAAKSVLAKEQQRVKELREQALALPDSLRGATMAKVMNEAARIGKRMDIQDAVKRRAGNIIKNREKEKRHIKAHLRKWDLLLASGAATLLIVWFVLGKKQLA